MTDYQEFEHYVDGRRVVVKMPKDIQIAPFDALTNQLRMRLLNHNFCGECKLNQYYCNCEVEL